MSLPEGDIKELTWALLDEAVDEEHEFTDEINIDQLRAILDKQEVLVDSLTTRSVFSFYIKEVSPSAFKYYSNQSGIINILCAYWIAWLGG